jgi:TonB family protein
MKGNRTRLGGALGVSIGIHAVMLTLVILLVGFSSGPVAVEPSHDTFKYVHVVAPGVSGGGGGSPRPAAPRPAEVPAHQPVSPVNIVPVSPAPEPPPELRLDAPIQTDMGKVLQATGTNPFALPGPGGGKPGTGAGPGTGPGFGPGGPGGFGDGARQVGDGVIGPSPIRMVQPEYTSDAMRAKVQGSVTLEAIVKADGTVGDVRVIQSLDRNFGLDQRAIDAAKKWLFRAGTFQGKPTDVIVRIILDFRIH